MKSKVKKPIKFIYVVTAMRFGYNTLPEKIPNKDGIPTELKVYHIQRDRVWGWLPTLEMAQKAVDENWCDMYEIGYYPHLVIEKVPEGIMSHCSMIDKNIQCEWWYKWSGSEKKGKYKPWKKPNNYKNIFGFAMG